MRFGPSLFPSLLLGLAGLSSFAGESDDPTKVAQSFYDHYIKTSNANGDPRKEVMNSAQLTPGFKKAFAAVKKEPDSDPIIVGQDYPKTGFKAAPAAIKGDTAKVTMTSRDPQFKNAFSVTLVKKPQGWLISGVGTLREK